MQRNDFLILPGYGVYPLCCTLSTGPPGLSECLSTETKHYENMPMQYLLKL